MARSSSILYNIIFVSIGFLYPAYCSLLALQTKEKTDDAAWLMYWVVLALFTIFEFFADIVLSWLPLYSMLKIGFLTWCVAPIRPNGAYYLYKAFIGPFFHMYGGHINDMLTSSVSLMQQAKNYFL